MEFTAGIFVLPLLAITSVVCMTLFLITRQRRFGKWLIASWVILGLLLLLLAFLARRE